jgi:phosphoheptose isomerase
LLEIEEGVLNQKVGGVSRVGGSAARAKPVRPARRSGMIFIVLRGKDGGFQI